MRILLRILINAVALAITAYLLPGIVISGGIVGFLLVAVIFGVVNALIRPIISLLSMPITCLTLGLFSLVINAAMLLLTGFLAGNYLNFTGGIFESFLTALLAGIIISAVSALLSWLLPDKKKRKS
jgi:putative membrane protein